MARGDQIYAYREFLTLQGVYEHHGIDCGDGSVIHYRKTETDARIERTSRSLFAQGNLIYTKEYRTGFCFIPEDVVRRAESRLGEDNYNLLFNNCEHFATWCKTGFSDSKQVRDFVPAIGKLKIDDLAQPLQGALKETNPRNAEQMVERALADVKVVWEQLQPQYQEALREMETWQRVAWKAVEQNRDDLARAALMRKLDHKKRAAELEKKLQELAAMTETLLRNSNNLQPTR
ncbi:MAG: lecithin retinol acyltransferase family protein [Cyanophyceae cyanobacterium]